MNIAIIYSSSHHGNTEKVCKAIAEKYDDIKLYNIKDGKPEIGRCDIIGIASGIAYGSFYTDITEYVQKYLPKNKKVFFIYTAGDIRNDASQTMREYAESRGCKSLGTFACKGYDTYGLFKLFGGINKCSPTQKDLSDAVTFFDKIYEKV